MTVTTIALVYLAVGSLLPISMLTLGLGGTVAWAKEKGIFAVLLFMAILVIFWPMLLLTWIATELGLC